MGAYDAYQLSVRDSTEFTVANGSNSVSDQQFSIAEVLVDFTNASTLQNSFRVMGAYCYDLDNEVAQEYGVSKVALAYPYEDIGTGGPASFNLPVIIPNSGGTFLFCEPTLISGYFDIAITGSIQIINNAMFMVKGPGTITISDKK